MLQRAGPAGGALGHACGRRAAPARTASAPRRGGSRRRVEPGPSAPWLHHRAHHHREPAGGRDQLERDLVEAAVDVQQRAPGGSPSRCGHPPPGGPAAASHPTTSARSRPSQPSTVRLASSTLPSRSRASSPQGASPHRSSDTALLGPGEVVPHGGDDLVGRAEVRAVPGRVEDDQLAVPQVPVHVVSPPPWARSRRAGTAAPGTGCAPGRGRRGCPTGRWCARSGGRSPGRCGRSCWPARRRARGARARP